jgi:hypothetical protein
MGVTVVVNAVPVERISYQPKAVPRAALATVLPSRSYRYVMTTVYRRPLAGFAEAGPQLAVDARPPKVSPSHVVGPATVRPVAASSSATEMLPVAPPGAVSEPWYRMSRPTIWHGFGASGVPLRKSTANPGEHCQGP